MKQRTTTRRARRVRVVAVALVAQLSAVAGAMVGAPPARSAAAPTCQGEAATIVGTAGPDTLAGTPGPDVIVGLGGPDTIRGLAGEDVLCGGAEADEILGGTGDDRIDVGLDDPAGDVVRAGPGRDSLVVGGGPDQVASGADGDFVFVVEPGDGMSLDGGGGEDTLIVGPIDDVAPPTSVLVDVRAGEATVDAQTATFTGYERYLGDGGGTATVQLQGGGRSDYLEARRAGRVRIAGGAGDDDIWAGLDHLVFDGDDRFLGGPGHDSVSLLSVPAAVYSFDLATRAATRNGARFATVASEDLLALIDNGPGQRGGSIAVSGSEGSDGISVGARRVEVDARGGDDLVSIVRSQPYLASVDGGSGDDRLFGSSRVDHFLGGPGDDELSGAEGDDSLTGGEGTDRADGGAGSDTCSAETEVACEG